jgi:Tol biopolymer transport system component
VRDLSSSTALPLAGTEGAREPFWSFDSRSIAFIVGQRLNRIDASGGSVLKNAEPAAQGGAWNKDDVILFVPTNTSPIYRVSASGGVATAVTTLDRRSAERTHDYPVFLPDGNHFLYLSVGSSAAANETNGVFLTSLENPRAVKRLPDIGSTLQYSNGHLLFLRDTTLVARPFDTRRLNWAGDPRPIAENIAAGGVTGRGGAFTASLNGLLAFQAGSSAVQSQLRWFDREGKLLGSIGSAGEYQDPALSPDERNAVVAVLDPQRRNFDIAVFDLERGLPQKLTTSSADEIRPVWSPDGRYIAFGRRNEGLLAMYRKRADGTGTEDLLLDNATPVDWSADGRHILFLGRAGPTTTRADLWVFSLEDRKSRVYVETPFIETVGAFSPDGRWLAYTSNETGSLELYVAGFPDATERRRVSSDGAVAVRWRDARELFYAEPDGNVVAVSVDGSGKTFEIKESQRLFPLRARLVGRPVEVTGNGQRFLVNTQTEDSFAAPITLVINWPRLIPNP